MMEQIRILSCCPQDVTVIGNAFLDRFLPEANGDFLRVYLYLLRSAGRRNDGFTLCSVADRLNCTENDVLRALRYWEREKVLGLTCAEDGSITEVRFLSYRTPAEEPGPVPEKASEITSERMSQLGENEEIRELFFVAQQYIGRPLSRSEMQKICFFYDTLHFSTDLIDYLIDYCVSRGKMSFHYMEKVALSWKEQGISTVHEARVSVGSYHREYYDILKALGMRSGIRWTSCPTCGRTRINVEQISRELQAALTDVDADLSVAVMGCVVNGPGEARDKDIALCGGDNCAALYIKGQYVRTLRGDVTGETVRAIREYLHEKG